MKLDDSSMRLIKVALSHRVINVSHLIYSSSFLDRVHSISKNIYANSEFNGDTRTLDRKNTATLIGELGETGISDLCKKVGLNVIDNDEKSTHEHHWDIMIESLKCEIKFQGEGFEDTPKEFFGFTTSTKDNTLRQKWDKVDAIISFYLKFYNSNLYIIPWHLIDNEALNPSRNLYVRSNFNSGYYLQMGKSNNFWTSLNVNPKMFTF